MKQKYKYEFDATLDHNPQKPMYRLKTTKADKEIFKVVGVNALTSMYHDKRITGHLPAYIKEKIGAPRRKVRSDKGRAKGSAPKWNLKDFEVVAPIKSAWAIPASELLKPKWNVPEEMSFKPPINIKAYYYEKDGRFRVVGCDGIELNQNFDVEEWAQEEVLLLNFKS